MLRRDGDEVHLVHVIPRKQPAAAHGAPPVDYLPQEATNDTEQMIKSTHIFVEARFLKKLQVQQIKSRVHMEKVWEPFNSVSEGSYDVKASHPLRPQEAAGKRPEMSIDDMTKHNYFNVDTQKAITGLC